MALRARAIGGFYLGLLVGCGGVDRDSAPPDVPQQITEVGYFRNSKANRIFAFSFASAVTAEQIRAHALGQRHTDGQLTAAYYYPDGSRTPGGRLTTARDIVAANDLLYDDPSLDPWRYAFVWGPQGNQAFVDCQATPRDDLCRH